MTWFRVDDAFQRDPRVMSIPRPARGNAVGLYLLAGTWSAANLTDGAVPAYLPDELGVHPRYAASLVASGLWAEAAPGGWQFVEWAPNQKTREQVLAERAKRAASGAVGGRASGESRRRKAQAPAKQSASGDVGPGFDTDEPPARPGPARAHLLTYVSRLAGSEVGTDDSLPAELIEQWQEIAGPAVDLEVEAAAYLAHYADRPADDERAAWLGWLRRARQRNAPAPEPCPDQRCSGGWLGEDEDGRPIPCPRCRSNVRTLRGAS